jgi:hypothetical protein
VNNETTYSYDVLLDEPPLSGKKLETREQFRTQILAWAKAASQVDSPVYVEWGTEVNGSWFWWNALWYAEEQCAELQKREKKDCMARTFPKGTEKFREVFRHLRDLVNVQGEARNVRWIFHVTAGSEPDPGTGGGKNLWNGLANYYPGEKYVDAVGVSVYGAQIPKEKCDAPERSFAAQMDQVLAGSYREAGDSLKDVAAGKKVFVLEFGETLVVGNSEKPTSNCNAGKWARDALDSLFDASRWSGFDIAGFSWWNEAWVDETDGITDMRVYPFDLCAAQEGGPPSDNKVKGKSCDCWRGAAAEKRCDNIAGKRAMLRGALSERFNDYASSLLTQAGSLAER